MENNISKNIINIIDKVIYDPAHAITTNESDSKNLLYNEETYKKLAIKVSEIVSNYQLDNKIIPEEIRIFIINSYIKNNVSIRRSYFDAFEGRLPEIAKDELIYRTAYGALVKGEAMCAGYTEACRILCEASGIKTNTLLSKLPGNNKHLLHYVTVATTSDGKSIILDPEREVSCEKKGYNFKQYQNAMEYLTPTGLFFENKVGKNGVGPDVFDYIQDSIEHNNDSSLFFIDNDNNVYLRTFNMSKPNELKNTPCRELNNLISSDRFGKYIRDHKAVFAVHGTENIAVLSKIMDIAEKVYNNKNNESALGE